MTDNWNQDIEKIIQALHTILYFQEELSAVALRSTPWCCPSTGSRRSSTSSRRRFRRSARLLLRHADQPDAQVRASSISKSAMKSALRLVFQHTCNA